MTDVFAIHDPACPLLLNPFIKTTQFNKIKAWDIFALNHCVMGETLIKYNFIAKDKGIGLQTVNAKYQNCSLCGHCVLSYAKIVPNNKASEQSGIKE